MSVTPKRVFPSFFLGGFECSTHRTAEGHRLDVVAATQHDRLAREDYALCLDNGVRAVREAARWPMIDRGGVLELEETRALARLGSEVGVLQVWDLMHYGYPDDLDPLERSDAFVARFAAYAGAVAEVVREATVGETWYTPVNEISYFAYGGGEIGYMAPFGRERGWELKRVLVRAALAAFDAIRAVDPGARFLTVEPLVRVHPPAHRPEIRWIADWFNNDVVDEAFDMLAGRKAPELGGSREALGVVGLNYYAGNQWTFETDEGDPQRFLTADDPQWIPLHRVLEDLQARYGGPLVIAETGASGEGRAAWLRHLTSEAQLALSNGVELAGVCLYPIVTSPDWEDTSAFFDGGLFDLRPQPDGTLARELAVPVAEALREAQAALDPENRPDHPLPVAAASREVRIEVARPLASTPFKADNFSRTVHAAGEHLQIESYGLEPGKSVAPHRHWTTEHVLTPLAGEADVLIGGETHRLAIGESLLVPTGTYYTIVNPGPNRLILQQISGPKPWDARFHGPHPSTVG